MFSKKTLGTVAQTNEKYIKAKYDEIIEAKQGVNHCFLTLALKNFDEYAHLLGKEESERAVSFCYECICGCLSEGEFIARLHTHYFVIILKVPCELEAIHKRAHELHFAVRDAMEQAFGRKLFLEMGFCPMMKNDPDFYNIKYFADLCRVKTQHEFPETNYEIYYLSYNDQREEFSKHEKYVRPAIENGDFKLFLQPKVNLKTGKIESAEALVRWIDPERGFIPLSEFLPNLEENGLIRDVDLHLFETACGYMQKWQDKYKKPIQISFNLSRAYFIGPYFMPEYTQVFEKFSLPKSLVQVELLESVVFNDINRLQMQVSSVYDYGFTCALDDFGSGFSSFDVLTSVSLSELKIDRALFKDENNEKERILIKHIIDIAHDLNMKVVAEGVENEQYARYLTKTGCDFIQGYFYYKPMPADEFEQRFIINNESAKVFNG